MAPASYLVVNDANGIKQSILTLTAGSTGLIYLQWRLQRNGVHWCKFALDVDHNDVAYLVDKAQIEVWRSYKDLGLASYKSFEGLLRDVEYATDEQGQTHITCTAYGYMSMLAWRRILYTAGLANLSRFNDPAENVLKRLVNYNAGPYALAIAGRDRDGVISGITTEYDQGRGNMLTVNASRDNLLDTLLKYAGRQAGGDIDLIKMGVNSWQFRFYPGQRGTDKTATVVFALNNANMRKPHLVRNRSAERTVIIAAGAGEQADRLIALATGPNYSASNDIEGLLDDTQVKAFDTLQQRATQTANANAVNDVFTFEIVQTTNTAIDVQYTLGDLVLARYAGSEYIKVIDAVTFTYDQGAEKVIIDMADL